MAARQEAVEKAEASDVVEEALSALLGQGEDDKNALDGTIRAKDMVTHFFLIGNIDTARRPIKYWEQQDKAEMIE